MKNAVTAGIMAAAPNAGQIALLREGKSLKK
jgi:hypothetical protein